MSENVIENSQIPETGTDETDVNEGQKPPKIITPITISTPPTNNQIITTIHPAVPSSKPPMSNNSRSVSNETPSPNPQNINLSISPQITSTNTHNTSFHSQSSSFGQWNIRETLGLLQWSFSNLRGSPFIMESFEGAATILRSVGKNAHRENFYNSKNCCMRFIQLVDELPEKLKNILTNICGNSTGRVLSKETASDSFHLNYQAPTTAVVMKQSPNNDLSANLKQTISIQQNDRKQCAVHFQLFTKLIKHYAKLRKNEILKELEEQEEQFTKYERLMYKLRNNQLTEDEVSGLKSEMVKDMKTRGSQLHKIAQDMNLSISSPPLIQVSKVMPVTCIATEMKKENLIDNNVKIQQVQGVQQLTSPIQIPQQIQQISQENNKIEENSMISPKMTSSSNIPKTTQATTYTDGQGRIYHTIQKVKND